MTGKTHLTVGTAVAIAVVQPETVISLCFCAAAGAVGSVISDIDVDTSESHRGVAKLFAVLFVSALVLGWAEYSWHLGLVARLRAQSGLTRIMPGTLAFLAVCWFGMHQPHRSFMHSLPGLAVMTALAGMIAPFFALPFGAAMASHIAIDLLNRRRVRLLYPLHWGLSLDLCAANGWVDGMLCGLGSAALVVESVQFLFSIPL